MTAAAPVRFDTKIVIVVRDDLEVWQKLNVTAYLAAGVAHEHADSFGERYADADGTDYPPTFRQPVLVFAAGADELQRTLQRALARGAGPSLYTTAMFETSHDAANRAVVAAVPSAELDLAGIGFRAERKDADKITKGLHLHG